MKKKNLLATLFIVIMGLVLLAPAGAFAYTETIADTTLVLPYQGSHANGDPWTDIIAEHPTAWDITKTAITWTGTNLEMQIYTNYPQAGISTDGQNAGQADIALGTNGTYTVGIAMSGPNLGKIYTVSSWTHPGDLQWGSGSWVYGGKYDEANPKTPDVLIGSGINNLGTATVSWNTAPAGSGVNYVIDVIFPDGFNASGDWNTFNFELGSGTCANEVMSGTASNVPIPASAMLLGTGLLGMMLLRRRQQPEQA